MRSRLISIILSAIAAIIVVLSFTPAKWLTFSSAVVRHVAETLVSFENDFGGFSMFRNKDPADFDYLFKDRPRKFRSLEPDIELLNLEKELRWRNLLWHSEVQWLMEKAALCSDKSSQWAREQLRIILESDRIMDMRTGDVYRPLPPPELLSRGELHLLNVAGHPWKVPMNALTRGMLVTGLQGGGKSMFLIGICKQLDAAGIPFFVLDPKFGLKGWATEYLNAVYIDVEEISIDLSPPSGLTYEQFLTSLMPQAGEIIGVVYGIELMQECAKLCIGLRDKYIKSSGKNTQISLADIYQAVPFVTEVSRGRRLGYREAVSTGLSRILTGSGNLFRCRQGADLSTLFKHNVILGCRSITDEFAAKFLALFLLYWLYESERFTPPTDQLKRALILDDATLFLQAKPGFDAASKTSSFTHIFSRLRSSGNAVIAATQIPHLADTGILALSHTVLCIGGLHYGEDTRLLAQIMSLNEQQRIGITRLGKREAIGICAGSTYPGVVHGYTVDIPNL
jgi:hypothetical protein